MFETSTIELKSSALENNIRFIRKQMKKGVRLCSVVKGNAYGHGLSEFVQMAMKAKVDYFAVYSAEEAHELQQKLEKLPDLFIMGSIKEDAIEWAIKDGIEFAAFEFSLLEKALLKAKKLKTKAKIHLEMDTGMRRTGFNNAQIPALSSWLKKNKEHIVFQGLFTHFAGAESQANHFRVSKQILNFKEALDRFAAKNLKPVYHHSTCSAALLNYPETQGNMLRIGILQYGYWPNKETCTLFFGNKEKTPDLLKRMFRWTTKIMAIKEVKKGEFIGYGTEFLAHKNLTIAIIPVGYYHGYSRNLSNIGSVLIHGKKAHIAGIINMNSLSVDISHIADASVGDEVVLIGTQKSKAISVNSFSEQSQLLNYELLTRLPANIPRIIKK